MKNFIGLENPTGLLGDGDGSLLKVVGATVVPSLRMFRSDSAASDADGDDSGLSKPRMEA